MPDRASAHLSSLISHRALVRALLALTFIVGRASAQQLFAFTPRTQPELGVEAGVARYPSALVRGGVNIPLGYYVRAGATLGAGVRWRNESAKAQLRADLSARFLLDPFGEKIWGPYVGGGLTIRRDADTNPVTGVMLVLGVEGRRGKRSVPSVEAALGEGTRLAVIMRRARSNGR